MAPKEALETVRIVRHHGLLHTWSFSQRPAPSGNSCQAVEHTGRGDGVEDVEIPEDRRKDRIDEAEPFAGKEGAFCQLLLKVAEFTDQRRALCLIGSRVFGRFESPEVGEDRRTEFDPAAVPGARQWVSGMEWNARLRFFEIFADHGAFKKNHLRAVLLPDNQQRHLASGEMERNQSGLAARST